MSVSAIDEHIIMHTGSLLLSLKKLVGFVFATTNANSGRIQALGREIQARLRQLHNTISSYVRVKTALNSES